MCIRDRLDDLNLRLSEGWTIRTSRLTEDFTFEAWQEKRVNAVLLARVSASGAVQLLRSGDKIKSLPGTRLISLVPPQTTPVGGAGDQAPIVKET